MTSEEIAAKFATEKLAEEKRVSNILLDISRVSLGRDGKFDYSIQASLLERMIEETIKLIPPEKKGPYFEAVEKALTEAKRRKGVK